MAIVTLRASSDEIVIELTEAPEVDPVGLIFVLEPRLDVVRSGSFVVDIGKPLFDVSRSDTAVGAADRGELFHQPSFVLNRVSGVDRVFHQQRQTWS